MDSRDILIGHINDGIDTTQIVDNSNKSILIRGCDPEIYNCYSSVKLSLCTHDSNDNITEKDRQLARLIDEIGL